MTPQRKVDMFDALITAWHPTPELRDRWLNDAEHHYYHYNLAVVAIDTLTSSTDDDDTDILAWIETGEGPVGDRWVRSRPTPALTVQVEDLPEWAVLCKLYDATRPVSPDKVLDAAADLIEAVRSNSGYHGPAEQDET